MADLVIRGGTIIDGSGGEPIEADIAIVGGKISAIGPNLPKGDEEIDATGKIVTPGFVDPHNLTVVLERGDHGDGWKLWRRFRALQAR
jgi:N-acyl-D-aspartate/D-glutamate deacylase